jgi:signal transduction histidine kinase/DNA-binding response OmpR family regulator/HPt (histidine-containing phosphotransfer) domain-containing protein
MAEQVLHILVVEDDDLDRMIMKRALNASGIKHELHIAVDHESGLAAAIEREYDCIFLDYNLPGGTGLELLMAIREAENTSPIIIVTSQGDEKLAVQAMRNGANDYIPKVLLSPEGIAQSVRYMVNLKKTEQERILLQAQLVDTQRRLQTVVANSPIILFSLDETATFTLFEGKGLSDMGINKNEFLGLKLESAPMLPLSMEDFNRAMQGEEVTIVAELKDKFFEIFYTPTLNDNNKAIGVIGVASDITDHKKAEEALLKAKQVAEETAKIKEQFLANMSHEIRTPMNGIIGLTRILLESPLDEEQNKYLRSIKTCSDNLLVIINDILDFSKIEAGKMSFENVAFKVPEIAQHAVELFQTKADERSIKLITNIDPQIPSYVCGDPTRLSQILNNLISNAIKFTEKGEVTISIKLRSSREDNITLDFEVKDSGIGIPESSLGNIFESFTQASSDTTRKFGGTGLGLTIVKNMIELQGGSIGVRSQVGTGTTFFFHLSFKIADETELQDDLDLNQEISTSHLRILAAEDNPINQMVIKKLFADWDTQLDCADNGRTALEKIQQNHYDLVLMDIQMPEMDGHTACKKIRSELPEHLKSIPVIAMTAHATSQEKQKCYDAGMNDYISKPFNPIELKKKILKQTQQASSALKASHPIPEQIKPSAESRKTMNLQPVVTEVKQVLPVTDKTDPHTPHLIIENPSQRHVEEPDNETKINLNYLKQIADGNDEFIIEMIEMFLNKTPQALEEMSTHYKESNWEALKQIAHRIKPSFAYIGLSGTQQVLSEIEKLSEEADQPEKVGELMNSVDEVCKSAFSQLQQELVGMK